VSDQISEETGIARRRFLRSLKAYYVSAAVLGVCVGNITLRGMILQCVQIAGQQARYEESQRQSFNNHTIKRAPTPPCISHLLSTVVRVGSGGLSASTASPEVAYSGSRKPFKKIQYST